MPALPAPLLGSTGTTTFVLTALLVAVGVAMVITTVWLVRATRTDSRALGPLEVMGDRRWHRADADRRARSLEAARPAGALPPAPILDADLEPAEPEPAAVANCESCEQESASTSHSSAEAAAEDPQPAETA